MSTDTKCIHANHGKMNIQIQHKYKWVIDNFPDCCKNVGEFITSPEFYCGTDREMRWRLMLYPCGYDENNKEFLSLSFVSLNNFEVRMTYEIFEYNQPKTLKAYHEFKENEIHTLPRFCDRKLIKGIFRIIITCKILEFNKYDPNMLIKNKDFSDVTIKIDGKEFRAHKAILAAQSNVLAEMFKDEKETDIVEIQDMDKETFQAVLEFIYTGKVNNINRIYIAQPLLMIADKYELQGLKNICVDKINQNLSIYNAVDILEFAERNNVEVLKKNAIDFIALNAKSVINASHPILLQNLPSKTLVQLFCEYVLQKKD